MTGRVLFAGLAVFVLALGLRVAYIHEHHDVLGLDMTRLPQTDNFVFHQWAANIAEGDWLCREQPHAWHLWTRDVAPEGRWLEWYGGPMTYHQSPLYAYLVAAVYAGVARSHDAVGYVQAFLGALTCLLVFMLGRRMVSLRVGLLAGLLLALCAPFYFYDAFVLRDGLMALLVMILALALDRAVQRGRTRDWIVAGAALGLFTLGKETGVPLLGLTLLGVAVAWWRQPGRVARTAALLLVGWLVLVGPAFARNVIVGAPTTKLSTRGPEVLIAGNAQGQDGVSWDPPVDVMREILMESNFSLLGAGWRTLATHRADPLGFLDLIGNKTRAFFNGYEVPNNVNFYLHRAHLKSLKAGVVSVTFLGPAALLGLLLAWNRRKRMAVAYGLFGALTASVIALYILARFRLQVLPLLALFAAVTLDWAWTAWRGRRTAALVFAGVLFALLTTWSWSDRSAYNDLNKNTSIMLMHLKSGNVEQAIRYRDLQWEVIEAARKTLDESFEVRWGYIEDAFAACISALSMPESSAEHHRFLGDAYQALVSVTKRGEKIEMGHLALEHYARALARDAGVRGAHHGIGRVQGLLGEAREAVVSFQAEIRLHSDHGPAHKDLGTALYAWNGMPVAALTHFEQALLAGTSDPVMLATAAHIQVDTLLKTRTVDVGPGQAVYDPPLALARARRALRLAPDDPAVLDHVAPVLYANGAIAKNPGLIDEAIDLVITQARLQPWRSKFLLKRAATFADFKQRMVAGQLPVPEEPVPEDPVPADLEDEDESPVPTDAPPVPLDEPADG